MNRERFPSASICMLRFNFDLSTTRREQHQGPE
jgi:hypothetical protein